MGKVISILNFKGGCGKTTTAINLASALNICGKRVLVIDLDFQCNASYTLGFDPKEGSSIFELFNGSVKEIPIYEHCEGLDYIPSSSEMKHFNEMMALRNRREYILKKLTDVVRDGYDYVLVDCPANGGLLNVNAMCASDELLIPIDCEPYSLHGVVTINEQVSEIIADDVNTDIRVLGFLRTRYDKRQKCHREASMLVEKELGSKLLKSVIRINTSLNQAAGQRKSIYEYDPKAAGAEDYMSLAKEVMKKCK